MRFAVLFAGVRPRVPELAQILTDQLDTPSLHVIGERDRIKPVGNAAPACIAEGAAAEQEVFSCWQRCLLLGDEA